MPDGQEPTSDAVRSLDESMRELFQGVTGNLLPKLMGDKVAGMIHRGGFDEVEFLERLVDRVYVRLDVLRGEEPPEGGYRG